MAEFAIVEARPWHCGAMTRRLRVEQRDAVVCLGVDAHRELRARFDDSSFRRAWLVDGQLAALGGVTGCAMSPTGYVWLALAPCAARFPVAAVKEARRQLAEIFSVKRELVTTILPRDLTSWRFAALVGFRDAGCDVDIGRGRARVVQLHREAA